MIVTAAELRAPVLLHHAGALIEIGLVRPVELFDDDGAPFLLLVAVPSNAHTPRPWPTFRPADPVEIEP